MKCVPEVFRDKGTLVAACPGCGWVSAERYPQDLTGLLCARMEAACHKVAVAMFGGGNR